MQNRVFKNHSYIRFIVAGFTVTVLLTLAGCVSRYQPLKQVHPLSGRCEDYSQFSFTLAKQRDYGFTKRATINIAGYSVGSEENRDLLYKTYKPIIEIIYADRLISQAAARATGKVICEHKLTKSWPLMATEQYREIARIVRQCQKSSYSEGDIEDCLLAEADDKPDPDLIKPPV